MGQGLWPSRRVATSDLAGILPVSKGGTGADNATDARANLGISGTGTPLAAKMPVQIGVGNSINRTFDLPSTGVTGLMVIVEGTSQPADVWSQSVGTGEGGVDQVVFAEDSIPGDGLKVEVFGFV